MAIRRMRRVTAEPVRGWYRWLALVRHATLPPPSPLSGSFEPRARHDAATDTGSNAEPFEALFWQHERAIFGYLWHMCGNEQTARDLTQETFLRAWQHFDQVRDYTNPGGWLFRVATNLALTDRRRRASPVGGAAPLEDERMPESSDPTAHFVERDLVRQILTELTPRQRAALILREVYGLSRDELSRALGISYDATNMTLWRARAHFRARYLQAEGRS